MIRYKLYQKNPASHYIYIDMQIDTPGPVLNLHLPSWRPGRYELGNFAKNIKRVDVWDQEKQPLSYTKHSKDAWAVNCDGAKSVTVTYSYFAAELNAGACFADISQVYVNPVHCCMYAEGREQEEHVIELEVPDHYSIATSLRRNGKTLIAKDYEELVDSPFIASARIQTDSYEVNGIRFYLHFNGECRPDWKKFIHAFTAFTEKQIEFWGDFPYDEYHFLFQVVDNKFYHGVEHKKNTVIAIGPGYAINSGVTLEDILGVSCHELFHVWNIKTIRPREMSPYNYKSENYARTGYVYEGFTTYYGDKLLYTAGVFTLQQYFITLEERLVKHFHNFGRYNLSVAHSSFETWLDGYTPGAPYRKTNIYDEGSLIAFMLDIILIEASGGQRSLRDLCRLMYERFGKRGAGYSEDDVIGLVGEIAQKDMREFFSKYVYTPSDFAEPLDKCFALIGLRMHQAPSTAACEREFGFKAADNAQGCRVTLVAPYSPAWKCGLFAGDEIVAVNNRQVKGNLNQWLQYYREADITLTVSSSDLLRNVTLSADKRGQQWFWIPRLEVMTDSTEAQQTLRKAWEKL